MTSRAASCRRYDKNHAVRHVTVVTPGNTTLPSLQEPRITESRQETPTTSRQVTSRAMPRTTCYRRLTILCPRKSRERFAERHGTGKPLVEPVLHQRHKTKPVREVVQTAAVPTPSRCRAAKSKFYDLKAWTKQLLKFIVNRS